MRRHRRNKFVTRKLDTATSKGIEGFFFGTGLAVGTIITNLIFKWLDLNKPA